MKRVLSGGVALFIFSMFFINCFNPAYAGVVSSGQYRPAVFPTTETTTWAEYGEMYGIPKSSNMTMSILHNDPQLNGEDALFLNTLAVQGDIMQFMKQIDFQYGDTIELEAKIRMDAFSGQSQYLCVLSIQTDANDECMIMNPDKIFFYTTRESFWHSMDTTDTYHVYRIVVREHTIKVYIDGSETPAIDAPFASNFGGLRREVQFGDTSFGSGMKTAWAYVKYKVVRPDEEQLICHRTGKRGRRTLRVPPSAFDSHMRHGDSRGECR